MRFTLLATQGDESGRAKFERLVTDVVKVVHSTAREVRANPGDWGIDTFVGQLNTGAVAVWQSKFFMNPGDKLKSQQDQIRESYKSATSMADREGLTLVSWTLAMPGTMDPAMTAWWDGWVLRERRKRRKVHAGFEIQLWQEADLRSRLMQPDFAHVRAQYFGEDPMPAERQAEDPPDPTLYDGALFIKQLHAAGVKADNTARRAFFNAEVLTRDIKEREAQGELAELRSLKGVVEQLWSTRYEATRATRRTSDGQLPGLYPSVCMSIEGHHASYPNPTLRDTVVHRTGLIHHLAEEGLVGWIEDFAQIADEHAGGST